MDEAMSLLLTLQVRSIGYEALNEVSNALDAITGSAGVMAAAAAAAALGLVGMGAAAAGLAVVTEQAGRFDQSMVEVGNNANMTDAEISALGQNVLNVARNSGLAIADIAAGFMHIADEGFHGADAVTVMNAAAESAASTGANVNNVANTLASTLHQWGLQAQYAGSTMDTLHVASALSNVTLQDFTSGLRSAAPIASLLGVGIDETSAALATMTRNGFSASQAGTQVKNLLNHLVVHTPAATAAIKQLSDETGIDLTHELTQGGLASLGFTKVLTDLSRAVGGNVNAFADLTGQQRLSSDQAELVNRAMSGDIQAMEAMVPATRGLYAEFILTGKGAADYVNILQQIAASHKDGGVTAENFARWEQTLGAQMDILKTNVHVAAIEIGENFTPYLVRVVQFLTDDAIPGVETLAGMFGSALLPAVTGLANAWHQAVAAFQGGDLMGYLGQLLQGVLTFAGDMFSAGANLVEQLGAGMMQAAETVLTEVVNEIASFIASFFVGNSPPPVGPLSTIDKGGENTMAAWVDGAMTGVRGVSQVADQATIALAAIPDKARATELTNQYLQAKQAVYSLKDAGADAKDALADMQRVLDSANESVATLNQAAAETKAQYEDQIQPLQNQLDILKQQVDTQYELNTAAEEQTLAQDQLQMLKDQGDPNQRASLQAQLESIKNQQQELDIESQLKDIEAKKKESAGDKDKIASLELKQKELEIQKQLYDMQNHGDIDALKAKDAQLKAQQELAKSAKAVEDANRKVAELKLEDQIRGIKAQEDAALKPIKDQLDAWKNARIAIQDQVSAMKENVADIGNAATRAGDLAGRLGDAAKAAKGLGGGLGGFHPFPKGGFPKGPPKDLGDLNPTELSDKVNADIKGSIEKATLDAVSAAQAAASKAVEAWVDGFGASLRGSTGRLGSHVAAAIVAALQGIGPVMSQVGSLVSSKFVDALSRVDAGAALALFFQRGVGNANLGTYIGTAFEALKPVVGQKLSDLGSFVSSAFIGALSKFDPAAGLQLLFQRGLGNAGLGTYIGAAFDTLKPTLLAKLSEIGTAIDNFLQNDLSNFGKYLDSLIPDKDLKPFEALVAVVHFLEGAFQAVLSVLDYLKPTFEFVAVGVITLVEDITKLVTWLDHNRDAWDKLKVVLLAAVAVFLAVTAPVQVVIAALVGLGTVILYSIAHWNEIRQAVAVFADYFGTKVREAVDFVGETFDGFFVNLGAGWFNFWEQIKQDLSDVWAIVVDGLRIGWDVIKGIFQVALDLLSGNWDKAWTDVKKTLTQVWDDIKQYVSDAFTFILDDVSTGAKAMLAVLSSFVPQWAQVGDNLVDALKNAVISKAKEVADAAGALVQQAIDKAKHTLGINSPSRVFLEIGHAVGDGLVNGLNDRQSAAALAGGSLVGATTAGGSLVAGGSRPVGGGVTVVVTGNYVLNEAALSDLTDRVGRRVVAEVNSAYYTGRFQ